MELPDSLAAQIDASPGDPAPYAVAADWLQHHGDPHGELIALALADADPRRRRELQDDLDPVRRLIVDPGHRARAGWHVDWRWGFIVRASHRPRLDPDAARFERFVQSPTTRFLQELAIEEPDPALVPLLGREPPRSLRSLVLQSEDPTAAEPIDLRAVVAGCPYLEHLVLHVRHEAVDFTLPALVELAMLADDQVLASLDDAHLPALRSLRLWLLAGASDLGTDLAPARFPALRHLAIVAPPGDLDLAQLAAMPIAAQLATLETCFLPTWQRDPRRFLIDRAPVASADAAVLDMGRSPASIAGQVTRFDPSRTLTFGRATVDDLPISDGGGGGRIGRIEWSGAAWSLQARSGTRLDGLPVTHVELRSGDELQLGWHVFRFVTGDLEPQLAELRARFALPTPLEAPRG